MPGLLVVDDLQWADEASLDVLAYLVHRLEGRPLLVVACWRSEQVPADARLRRLAAETRRAGRAASSSCPAWTPPRWPSWSRAVAPARAGAAALLHERTEGLPFLVLEYLAAVGEDGELPALLPGGARDLLAARVRGVGDAARQVLATAAVLGRSFEVDTARAASGRSDEEAVAALEELAARGLVHEVAGDVYDFGHGLVRDLVYEQTSLARRRLLHRRVGEALAAAARGRRPQEPPAASIARHLELGGAPAEAAGYHRLAGDQARAVFANREALGHYRAAAGLGHPDPAGLHAAIGDLETLLGNYDAALAAYTEAAGAAEERRPLGHRAEAGGRLCPPGRLGRGRAAPDRRPGRPWQRRRRGPPGRPGRRPQPGRPPPGPRRRRRAAGQGRPRPGRRGRRRRRPGQGPRHAGHARAARGDHDDARRHLEQSLALAEALPDPSARVAALNNLALAHRATGEVDLAVEHTRTALELCARPGRPPPRGRPPQQPGRPAPPGRPPRRGHGPPQAGGSDLAEVGGAGTLEPEIWKLVSW